MDKDIAIEFENVGKQYRLGMTGTGSLQHDLNRWWQTTVRGKEDPYLTVGEVNDRTTKGNSEYVWALKDITFNVKQGDVVGIIGKNGAGKSTLLKLLSHITAPSIGEIRYRGRIASLLEVGTGFHYDLTGRENIYMNGNIMGMTKHEIDRKLDEIVDFAGVERYIDTPVKRYSSGMNVRLGFAVAAFLEPEILVVDEVLTVGDAEFQKKAIGKMDSVAKTSGRTVLFVSHNMSAVKALCRSGIVLQNGGLIYQGSASGAIDEYMRSCLPADLDCSVADMPRTGDCSNKVRFVDIEFLDRNDQTVTPRCGNYIKIRLTVEASNPGHRGCRISFGFCDLFGDILTEFPTDVTMEEITLSPGRHTLDLEIEKLPLTAGSYKIFLWADVDRLCSDNVDKTIQFNVEEDDFFGCGRNFPEHVRGKIVLCNHKWTVK